MPSTGNARSVTPECFKLARGPLDRVSESAAAELNRACGLITTGRITARKLAMQVRGLGLGETQVRLLWLLRSTELAGNTIRAPLDQTRMAAGLGLSAAQISSVVDRLREQGAIVHQRVSEDRRRQLWQLTPTGLELIDRVMAHLAGQVGPQPKSDKPDMHVSPEAA